MTAPLEPSFLSLSFSKAPTAAPLHPLSEDEAGTDEMDEDVRRVWGENGQEVGREGVLNDVDEDMAAWLSLSDAESTYLLLN
jgi:hypothetical protein